MVDALADEVAAAPSADLVVLLQRAAGHVVKVIMRADDSNGMIGDLARQILDLHRQACARGVAEPKALAKWMVRFAFDDQDFFEIDPVAYAAGSANRSVHRGQTRLLPGFLPNHSVTFGPLANWYSSGQRGTKQVVVLGHRSGPDRENAGQALLLGLGPSVPGRISTGSSTGIRWKLSGIAPSDRPYPAFAPC